MRDQLSVKTSSQIVLSLILAALTLELGARIAATVKNNFATIGQKWYVYSSTVGWARRPNFQGTLLARGVTRYHKIVLKRYRGSLSVKVAAFRGLP